jgi:hypothetical protein
VVRALCTCAPAGQENFFEEVGVRVARRRTTTTPMDEAGEAAFREKAGALAAKYRTEFVPA